jgi:predicted amidohydrolase
MTVVRAAAIQTAPAFGDRDGNIRRALALIPADLDLAVLPELFSTGYLFTGRDELRDLAEEIPGGPACDALRQHAAATGITLVAGLAERHGDRIYNSAVLVRPDGSVERYRKLHLFAGEKDVFDPGDLGLPVFTACGTTIGMMVCFDWLFPEAAGTLARRGARIIAHPSNLVLPHGPDAMPVRALENRVFTVTANRTGVEQRGGRRLRFIGRSLIASPAAERLAECAADREDIARADLDVTLCNPYITPVNHVVADRRPDAYR